MTRKRVALWLAVLFALPWLWPGACRERDDRPEGCVETPADDLGPFYRPGAPVRGRVGTGYRLGGRVLSALDCRPLPGARIEYWLVNPQGQYDDDRRATIFSDRQGAYRFETNQPGDYVGRLPHIHLLVTGAGHQQLITQHYPAPGQVAGTLDLVLAPRQ